MISPLKKVALSTTLVMAALITSACGSDAGGSGGSSASAGSKPVRIAVGLDPTYALVFVAQEQGYFTKCGVEANLVQTEGGPSLIQAISGGQADFSYLTDLTSVSNLGANPDLTALNVVGQSDTNFFTVLGKGISDPSQIKTIAVVPGSAAYMTNKYLESEGIDPSSVKMVQAAFPDVPSIMSRGDADATIAIQPWADRVVEQAGGKIVGDIGDFDAYYALWLVTSGKWLADNKDAAACVSGALKNAGEYVAAHLDEAAALVSTKLKMPTDQALKVLKTTDLTSRDFNEEDAQQVKSATDFFVSQGKIKAGPTASQILKGWFTQNVK